MSVFVIAYDLKNPGKDYTSLISAIQTVPWCHAQGSVWFVEHPGPASTVRDILIGHMDANDVLFVDRVSDTWAGRNMSVCGNWLNARGC
jgi:hypothetical protein